MSLSAKRYALTLVVAGYALLAAVAAANLTIDPQQVFRVGLFAGQGNVNDRYHKYSAYRAAKLQFDGLLFASSRGLTLPRELLAARTGARFADFAVTAGLIGDHLPVVERAVLDMASGEARVRHVFLMLDADMFGSKPFTNRSPHAYLHPDLTGEDWSRFWIRYLTVIQFRAWNEILRATARHRDRDAGLRQTSAQRRIRLAALDGVVPPQAVRFLPDHVRQLAQLRTLVALCRQHGIDLTVALSPLHARLRDPQDLRRAEAVAAELAQIVPLWDFGAPPWLAERPDLWLDPSHFSPETGRMMIERIYTGAEPGQPFGRARPP